MTDSQYIATDARAGRPFTFTRVRGTGQGTEFLPGEGSRLVIANRSTDTLELVGLPARVSNGVPSGFLQAGDVVKVQYLRATVFVGEVDQISFDFSRGDEATQSVTVTGPWAKMARHVLRQRWTAKDGTSLGSALTSKLILNQADDGTAQTVDVAIREICWGGNNLAPTACGYEIGAVNVSNVIKLPFDECRDITIADALIRELRLFPAAVAYFDYLADTPQLQLQMPPTSGKDAAYVAAIPKTRRQYTYTTHPITGVNLEIETTGVVDGDEYRVIDHQTAGNTSPTNPDILYATVLLAGASSEAIRQSLTVHTELRPALTDKTWWKAKHPRLANVALNNFSISSTGHTGSGYAFLADCSAEELQAYDKNAEVETFWAVCRIETTDDIENSVYLEMSFVTTNFNASGSGGKTLTRITSSSDVESETLPTDLASQILAARSGPLRGERFTMRLGTAAQWPTIGDRCDGLILQKITVDFTDVTAELEFGAPEWLSPEDMAGLLTNFRNKRRASYYASRIDGKPNSGKDVEDVGIKPISATDWAPGIKQKTTIIGGESATRSRARSGDGESSGEGKIILDSAKTGGETVRIQDVNVVAGDEPIHSFKALVGEDAEIDVGVAALNGLKGQVRLKDGNGIDIQEIEDKQIEVSLKIRGENGIKVEFDPDGTAVLNGGEGGDFDDGGFGSGCNNWGEEDPTDGGDDGNGWSGDDEPDDDDGGGGGGGIGWGGDDCMELNGWGN